MSEGKEYTREEWVYIGMRFDGKKEKSYLWANVNDVDNHMWFSKPLANSPSVGGLYYVHVTHKEDGGTSVSTGGTTMPAWFGRYEDKDKVKMWASKDEAARQQVATKSMNTKASKEVPLEELYKDLTKLSKKLNSTERLALISKLSEIILNARWVD